MGDLVFVDGRGRGWGFDFWPAKVKALGDTSVRVGYFGGDSSAGVPLETLRQYTDAFAAKLLKSAELDVGLRRALGDAIVEVVRFFLPPSVRAAAAVGDLVCAAL